VFTKSRHWIQWWTSRIQSSPATIFKISLNSILGCDTVYSGRSLRFKGSFDCIIVSLCNVGTLLPGYTASRSRRRALVSPPWEPHHISRVVILTSLFLWWRAPQQMLRTHRNLEAYCVTLWWRSLNFFFFPSNGALVEWNWQRKTEVLGGKTCPSATLSTTNPTWTDPEIVPGPPRWEAGD
jgi:hypothetical protein